jgi:tetratricopeptide (TPR) repeat protein
LRSLLSCGVDRSLKVAMAEVDDWIQSARSEFEAGQRALAESYLEQARACAGSDFNAWTRIAVLYRDFRDEESALACIQKALDFSDNADVPSLARIHALLGLYLDKCCRFDEAERAYVTSVGLVPRASTFILLGFTRRRIGRLDDAEKALRQALSLEPAHEHALLELGIVLAETSAHEAIQLLTRFVGLCPASYRGHAELGYALIWSGALQDAEQPLRRGMQLTEVNVWPHLYLDLCLAKQHRPFPERESVLHQAQVLRSSFLVDLLLGDLYSEWGREADARRCYETFLRCRGVFADEPYTYEDLRRGGVGLRELRSWRLSC